MGLGVFSHARPHPLEASLSSKDPCGKAITVMRRPGALILVAAAAVAAIPRAFRAPAPSVGESPVLDTIAYHDPGLLTRTRTYPRRLATASDRKADRTGHAHGRISGS